MGLDGPWHDDEPDEPELPRVGTVIVVSAAMLETPAQSVRRLTHWLDHWDLDALLAAEPAELGRLLRWTYGPAAMSTATLPPEVVATMLKTAVGPGVSGSDATTSKGIAYSDRVLACRESLTDLVRHRVGELAAASWEPQRVMAEDGSDEWRVPTALDLEKSLEELADGEVNGPFSAMCRLAGATTLLTVNPWNETATGAARRLARAVGYDGSADVVSLLRGDRPLPASAAPRLVWSVASLRRGHRLASRGAVAFAAVTARVSRVAVPQERAPRRPIYLLPAAHLVQPDFQGATDAPTPARAVANRLLANGNNFSGNIRGTLS